MITKKCTALINLSLLKTHSSAILTLSLKNHYGSIPPKIVQTNRFHMRDLDCIVHVNSLAPIREKNRLCIADGLLAHFNQRPDANPKYQWRYSGLIIGTDPVAVETIGLKIINEKRKEAVQFQSKIAQIGGRRRAMRKRSKFYWIDIGNDLSDGNPPLF